MFSAKGTYPAAPKPRTPWINGRYMTVADVKRFAEHCTGEDRARCERALVGETDAWKLVKAQIKRDGLHL